ncbi:hypothetical protein SNK05_011794 [Fusarium graminearum]
MLSLVPSYWSRTSQIHQLTIHSLVRCSTQWGTFQEHRFLSRNLRHQSAAGFSTRVARWDGRSASINQAPGPNLMNAVKGEAPEALEFVSRWGIVFSGKSTLYRELNQFLVLIPATAKSKSE